MMYQSGDNYFHIGNDHDTNQDWSTQGTFANDMDVGYAIVCDGCSGSNDICGQLDIGARLLGLSAKMALEEVLGKGKWREPVTKEIVAQIGESTVVGASAWTKLMQLSRHSIYATLVTAISDGQRSNIMFYGDGWAFWKKKESNSIFLRQCEYTSNASFYLPYNLNPIDAISYNEGFGKASDKIMITDYEIKDKNAVYAGDFSSITKKTTIFPIVDLGYEFYHNCTVSLIDCELEYIGVASDGVGTFKKAHAEYSELLVDTELNIILVSLFGFKNLHTDFVNRRFKAFKREMKKTGMIHYDDLSVSALSFQ